MPVRSVVSTAWLLRALAMPSLGHADILTHRLVVTRLGSICHTALR